MLKKLETWILGLLAAAMTAFATSAMGVLTMPNVFTLDKPGMLNMVKISATPTLIAVFAYLKQSPIPKE